MASDNADTSTGNERGNRLKEQAQKIRQEIAALQATSNDTSEMQTSVNQFATDKSPPIIPVRGTYNASSGSVSNLTTAATFDMIDPITVNRSELIVKPNDIAAMNDRISQIFGSTKNLNIKAKQQGTAGPPAVMINTPSSELAAKIQSFLAKDDDWDKWVYSESSAAAEVDQLGIELVTDISKEFDRQAPDQFNWAVKGAISYGFEKLLAEDQERYPTVALQSLFRIAAVQLVIDYVATEDINLIVRLASGDYMSDAIEVRMNAILDKKFEEKGMKSPRVLSYLAAKDQKKKMTTMTTGTAAATAIIAEPEQEETKPIAKDGFFDLEPPVSSTTGTGVVDRGRLSDLSSLLDTRIAALPTFTKLTVLSFSSAYLDNDMIELLDIPPEDQQDTQLIETALKISLLGLFEEEGKGGDGREKEKEKGKGGWLSGDNPFAVIGKLQKVVDEETVGVKVKQAIADLKQSLATTTTVTAAPVTAVASEDRSKMIVASSSSSSSPSRLTPAMKSELQILFGDEFMKQGLSFDSLLEQLPSLAADMQAALDKDDKAEMQKLLLRLKLIATMTTGTLKKKNQEDADSGAVTYKGSLLRDWQKAVQAPEKKLFGQLDDLLSADNSNSNSRSKNKTGMKDSSSSSSSRSNKPNMFDRFNGKDSNSNSNNKKNKDAAAMRRELDRMSSLFEVRSAAEKFVITHFDPISRQEVGEISRKGASVLQSLLLTDIFRVTRIKYFGGAVIFGGELILRNKEQFVETIQQRLKESKLESDFDLIMLDDLLEANADNVSIEELALDEPFPTIVLFPKAWRSRSEVTLEESQKNVFSGKKIASFFHTAIITSFCGMSSGVLDLAKNSNDPNEIMATLPSTEQLQTMAVMIIATLGIQGVSNLVESIMARQRGVRLTHTSVPGLDFLTFGAKSTYLTLVRSWRDVFDMSAAHIGTAMTLSLAALTLGLKLMAGQSKEVIAAYPTLSVGFLQINAFVKAAVSSQFPDIFLALEPQSLVHLHWLVIVGAMSFIGQVTQLLPLDNTAGDKMLSAISKDSLNAAVVRIAVGAMKTILLFCAIFNVASINEGISRAKLLISYTITGGVGRGEFDVGPPVIDRFSSLDEARKILYFLFTFILIVSFLPTDLNLQDVIEGVSTSTPQLDALFRPNG